MPTNRKGISQTSTIKKIETLTQKKRTKTHNLHNPDPDLEGDQNERMGAKKQQTESQQHQGAKQQHISN